MPRFESPTTRLIRDIASGQHGIVSRKQLLSAGVPGRAIDGRLRNGWLLPACRGIYGVGLPVESRKGVWAAAVLAGGSGTALAGRSAASRWGLLRWSGQIDLLRTWSRSPSYIQLGPPGLVESNLAEFRRTTYLSRTDLSRSEGIVTTSVVRTLVDLAGILDQDRLRAAFNEADRKGLLKEGELRAWAARGSGWAGIARFRSLVEERHPVTRLTRSELEAAFLELCRKNGIPIPLVNQQVIGLEVDCLWPDLKLVVELDGYEFHAGRMVSIRDGARDMRLRTVGYRVIRFTYDAVVNHPLDVMRVVEIERATLFPG